MLRVLPLPRRNTWVTQVILPLVAKCGAPITLTAQTGTCTNTISGAALTAAINNGTTSPGAPLTLGVTVPGLATVSGSYALAAGQSYNVTLVATNGAGAQSNAS